jgi:hypothetical protein
MNGEALSDAELAFRRLVADRAAYAAWAAAAVLAWERDHVVWFHGYRNGVAVWRPERPPPDPDPERTTRFAPR